LHHEGVREVPVCRCSCSYCFFSSEVPLHEPVVDAFVGHTYSHNSKARSSKPQQQGQDELHGPDTNYGVAQG
jgi:coproporphyrinogen III oxidase-like Fe-S oxidoreductase